MQQIAKQACGVRPKITCPIHNSMISDEKYEFLLVNIGRELTAVK